MELTVPELEQRLAELQLQIERLSQGADGDVHPTEERLSGIADQYAESLKRWTNTVERHARAITQLETHIKEWKDAGHRVQEDASQRLNGLEAVIQREWDALRKIHEEPVKQLQEQATNLTEVCVATASAAQQGFDRAEARLASFEGEFHRRIGDLSRELQSAVAEIRARPPYPAPGLEGAAQWSLNDVTRLHTQLRDAGETKDVVDLATQLPPAHDEAVDTRTISAPAGVSEQPIPSRWRLAILGLALAIAVAGGWVWRLQGELRSAAGQVADAERKSQQASEDAARQALAARQEAAREISGAREMANRAQVIGAVLAAPDLIRFNLAGADSLQAASAQALWSRSRGLVFSGTRVPMPPLNAAYQIWLLTRAGPVSAATWVPNEDGTATVIREAPIVARPVIGVVVTLEGANGSATPSGPSVLSTPLPQ